MIDYKYNIDMINNKWIFTSIFQAQDWISPPFFLSFFDVCCVNTCFDSYNVLYMVGLIQ